MPDGAVPRDMMIAHLRELSAATDVPLNADFEAASRTIRPASPRAYGCAAKPALPDCQSRIPPAIRKLRCTISISRWRGLRAARARSTKAGGDVVFTRAAKDFIPQTAPDLGETDSPGSRPICRFAGADCLTLPASRLREEIEAIVAAVKPKPVIS